MSTSTQEFINKPNLVFQDVTGEEKRTYIYPDGSKIAVYYTKKICVRPSGAHRLEAQGGKWYITPGFLAIQIEAKEWSL